MGDFKQDKSKRSSGFGGRSRSISNYSKSRSDGFNRNREPVTMHQAVCDQCGKSCDVPFRPTEGKPIYCNDCFGGRKSDNDRGNKKFSQEKFNNHKAFARGDFRSSSNKGNNNELKEQLVILNSKMDRLIKAVESIKNAKSQVVKKKVIKDIPVSKVKKLAKKTSNVKVTKVKKGAVKKIKK